MSCDRGHRVGNGSEQEPQLRWRGAGVSRRSHAHRKMNASTPPGSSGARGRGVGAWGQWAVSHPAAQSERGRPAGQARRPRGRDPEPRIGA